MSKLKFTVTADDPELFGIPFLDMDADPSTPYSSDRIEGMLAIKCDGQYYAIPQGETDLVKIAVPEHILPEAVVIGLIETLKERVIPYFDVKMVR